MLNIVKNILAWADKEPMPRDEWDVFYVESIHRLLHQIELLNFKLRVIDDIVNPPADIAPKLGDLTEFLISAIDTLEYHPYIVGSIIAPSLRHKAVVKKQNLFDFLYERYIVVPPRRKIYNTDAGSVEGGLANALIKHFTWDKFDKMKALIQNDSLGDSRLILLLAFKRSLHKENVQQLLLEIKDNPLFVYEANRYLKLIARKAK